MAQWTSDRSPPSSFFSGSTPIRENPARHSTKDLGAGTCRIHSPHSAHSKRAPIIAVADPLLRSAPSRYSRAMPQTVRIALDGMGGDLGAAVVVPGAELSLARHPNIEFLVFGD